MNLQENRCKRDRADQLLCRVSRPDQTLVNRRRTRPIPGPSFGPDGHNEMADDWKLLNSAVDDTAMALLALSAAAFSNDSIMRMSFDWLMSLQCSDGGWAAFDRNVQNPLLRYLPFADHRAILDSSCPDITGRVLELFGKLRIGIEDRRVRRALRFLKARQQKDGSWYGRWGVKGGDGYDSRNTYFRAVSRTCAAMGAHDLDNGTATSMWRSCPVDPGAGGVCSRLNWQR